MSTQDNSEFQVFYNALNGITKYDLVIYIKNYYAWFGGRQNSPIYQFTDGQLRKVSKQELKEIIVHQIPANMWPTEMTKRLEPALRNWKINQLI